MPQDPGDVYDLEYRRAVEIAAKKPIATHRYSFEITETDYKRFQQIKKRLGMTSAQLFHCLILNHG
jgi:hypothetical protein